MVHTGHIQAQDRVPPPTEGDSNVKNWQLKNVMIEVMGTSG